LWPVVPVVAVLRPALAAASPSQPLLTKRALMASLHALPAAVPAAPHSALRATCATQAEVLFAASDAASYLPVKDEVPSLVSPDRAPICILAQEDPDARLTRRPLARSGAAPSGSGPQSLGVSTLAKSAALAETKIAHAALPLGATYVVTFLSAMRCDVPRVRGKPLLQHNLS
jgi:hypothetical protein